MTIKFPNIKIASTADFDLNIDPPKALCFTIASFTVPVDKGYVKNSFKLYYFSL
ncbi:hypothetical protein ACFQZI_18680 [Mucilaginibacter lutimaris]|uniref:Uncharacterized protein n=1 Tax=Mucilaginibacter lutimaris TaxID=931629 RepID=A0ABW2ZL18_9SPHI